jgi:protein-tyrosine phosphatase
MPVRTSNLPSWLMGAAIVALMTVVPFTYYRYAYTHSKRLRPIVDGQVYRSGSMTAAGFREAIAKYKIRTVVNLQEEAPDPDLPVDFFGFQTVKESEVVESAGATFVPLTVDLVRSDRAGKDVPEAVAELRRIFDYPRSYPVLIHCRAGLHRTGVVAAMYRMEYHGWTAAEAYRELKAQGFGEFTCHAGNDQVTQYVLRYQPRGRDTASRPVPARLTSRPAAE